MPRDDEHERKQMAATLVLNDRMSAVGTLAAGVAHEINNPLASVMLNLEILAEELRVAQAGLSAESVREMSEVVGEARQGAERVRKIVSGLQTFSRTDGDRRVPLDVQAVLDLSVNLAFNELKHRARLVKEYSEVPQVEADEARLGQVFINLLTNAAYAIPEGQAERNEIRLVVKTAKSGEVIVEVRDTGRGIPESLLGRIFDPFFTTKGIGEATGLGLSICHGIVASFYGRMSVESVVGKGSTFRVILPAAALAEHPLSLPPPPRRSKLTRAAVLVVDDDVMVGQTIRRGLAREHDVTVVTSGKEALTLIEEGKRFDLILCDLMMPTMTGIDFYAEISSIAPEVLDRIVFITGGAFTPAARAFMDRVPNPRLEKPFTAHSLRALARRFASKP